MKPTLLEVFCGRGGWSKSFNAIGWDCTGVDLVDVGYPFNLVLEDALTLAPSYLDKFDAVIFSPPCEDYARAWLPWLRNDRKPNQLALDLLDWSLKNTDRKNRLTECSKFAARHFPGSVRFGPFHLWGDIPLLVSEFRKRKSYLTGERPDLRAEIPPALADAVSAHFTAQHFNFMGAPETATGRHPASSTKNQNG